jgi:bifunctional non-homologous end joining protein LigD
MPARKTGAAFRVQTTKRGSVSKDPVVEIQGRQLKLSNLDKVLYPATGFTKGQVIDYYARIAPVLVPHLAGRPLTLKRYPNGVDSQYFFEKNATQHRPDWIKTAPIWSEGNRRNVNYILANDLPTVVWMANHRTAPVTLPGERHHLSNHDGV